MPRKNGSYEQFAQDPGESIGERVDTRVDPHGELPGGNFSSETRRLVHMAVLIEAPRAVQE